MKQDRTRQQKAATQHEKKTRQDNITQRKKTRHDTRQDNRKTRHD